MPQYAVVALFTVAKIQNLPECPLIDEWKRKMWCIHTHTHTHTKWSEILPFAATCMDLEGIIL